MWDRDKIRERYERGLAHGVDYRQALIDLLVATYPVRSVFGDIDCPGTRGCWFYSGLWPETFDKEGDIAFYDREAREIKEVKAPIAKWPETKNYLMQETPTFGNRDESKLPDDFLLLASVTEFTGGSAHNGNVSVGDVRFMNQAADDFYSTYFEEAKPD